MAVSNARRLRNSLGRRIADLATVEAMSAEMERMQNALREKKANITAIIREKRTYRDLLMAIILASTNEERLAAVRAAQDYFMAQGPDPWDVQVEKWTYRKERETREAGMVAS